MTKHENKFGMFIHWGVYSILAEHEQVLACLDMKHSEYEKLKDSFNPQKYDPEKWVLAAKAAGMKYICFTAKHHDGFCMWDTKATDYSIMNTPYGKDVLAMLAAACKKHGMLLSIYYSCPDWYHPHGYNALSTHQPKAKRDIEADNAVYRAYVKEQIKELLSNYGEIYTLFWDIPPRIVDKSINALARELRPNILINNRGFDEGDFSTPERSVPEGERFDSPTEACDSVGEQAWGYRESEDYQSIRYLTYSIGKIMAMGGSYLLNVGPTAEGEIPAESLEILEKVGDWYRRTEGVFESAEADDFDYKVLKYHCIALKKNGKTYLHLYDGISSSAVNLKSYPKLPKSVRLLNTGAYLPFGLDLNMWERNPDYTAGGPFLRIREIPVNELESEPITIEIEW